MSNKVSITLTSKPFTILKYLPNTIFLNLRQRSLILRVSSQEERNVQVFIINDVIFDSLISLTAGDETQQQQVLMTNDIKLTAYTFYKFHNTRPGIQSSCLRSILKFYLKNRSKTSTYISVYCPGVDH